MKSFSLIELMIALWVMTMTTVFVAQASLTLPMAVQDAARTADALRLARFEISTATASSTDIYSGTLSVERGEDVSRLNMRASVSWKSLFGTPRTLSFFTVKSVPGIDSVCDPFVSGDWSHPIFESSVPVPGIIAALTSTHTILIVALSSAHSANDATLLFYSVHGTSSPVLVSEFDNASTSRTGFSSVARDDDILFAGSAFASDSTATCKDGISCAQIQVYDTKAPNGPELAGAFSFATSSTPYAVAAGGTPAAVRSLTYSGGFLYAGLHKTVSGDEFNILDAHNPANLAWVSGIRVGRTVNNIQIRDRYAFVSTDDPARELLIVDIHDPTHPRVAGTWDARGSTSFGYGATSTVHNGIIRFGRSYTNNGSEFQLLDAQDPSHIQLLEEADIGTARDPESVRALLTQDWLTFALLTHRLLLWNTGTSGTLAPFAASSYELPTGSVGISLACRDNQLYIARNTATGGIIDVLRG